MTNFWSPQKALVGQGGIGNVIGPFSATDNAIARWNGDSTHIQNSGVFIDDANNITGANSLNASKALFVGNLPDPTYATFGAYSQICQTLNLELVALQGYIEVLGVWADINPTTVRAASVSFSALEVGVLVNAACTQNIDQVQGIAAIFDNAGSGNINTAWSSNHSAHNSGSGVITDLRSSSFVYANLGAGSTTNAYAIFIEDPNNDGCNTHITNAYGVYIEDQSKGTNRWAIKTGAGKVEFGDSLFLTSLFFNNPITSAALSNSFFSVQNLDLFNGGDGTDGGTLITLIGNYLPGTGVACEILVLCSDTGTPAGPTFVINSGKSDGATGIATLENTAKVFQIANNSAPLVDIYGDGKIDAHKGGLITTTSTANVSAAPTKAELTSSFGVPSDSGPGFMAVVDKNNTGTAEYLIVSNGADYWWSLLTKSL